MLDKIVPAIAAAIARIPGGEQAGQELAARLGKKGQRWDHQGQLSITGQLDSRSRGYSASAGSSNMRPHPPVDTPIIDRGLLELDNQPDGDSDRRGENGYALRLKRGIFLNEGESWVFRWGKVATTGTLEDGRDGELASGIDATYAYADCIECSDAKGRGADADRIVRVFYESEGDLPSTGEVIRYLRDGHGLAWAVRGGGGTVGQWRKVTAGWYWHASNVGRAPTHYVSDFLGSDEGDTTTAVYVRATSSRDPNLQPGDIVFCRPDPNGNLVCNGGDGLDDKIGVAKLWNNPASIPGGWILDPDLQEKYVVGYSGSGDFTYGNTFGGHPIRPQEHSSSESYDPDTTWNADGWKDTAWQLHTHTDIETLTKVTGVTVSDHEQHYHWYTELTQTIDEVGGAFLGASPGETGYAGSHNHENVVVDDGNHMHTAHVDYTEVWTDTRTAGVTIDPQTSVVMEEGVLSHVVNDPGHLHSVEDLTHTGTLYHREEDFRPPSRVEAWIRRVGPDDD